MSLQSGLAARTTCWFWMCGPRRSTRRVILPGAVSIPVAELKRRLKELPKNKQIVAYCRGPFCAFAPEAARYLDKKGFRTYVLDAGLPDWEAAGLPVEG
jgi:rhodanese-related sulfurtransferase